MAIVWNYENAAHLLRRAAFGGTPAEITKFLENHSSVDSAVDELLSFKPSKRRPPLKKDTSTDSLRKIQRWWLKQLIKVRRPRDAVREKLVLFWHGFLVSGADKQPELRTMSLQNRLFRLNAAGNFKQLIRDFNRDPANLFYLDGITNVASNDGVHVSANENFGRELMELFTLGVFELADDGTDDPTRPNYTEDDVHNLSRALTGWTAIDGEVGVWNPFDWDGGQYDDNGDGLPDPMVLFGTASNNYRIDEGVAGTPDDVLETIFSRTDALGNNQVGMFVARKLWSFYAYPPPVAGLRSLLATFAAEFASASFEVAPLLRSMWTHDAFYSDLAKSRAVKNPVDYVVGAMKALRIRHNAKSLGTSDDELSERLERMGMNLFLPPNVAGWPGGLSWINSGTLLERLALAKDMAATERGSGKLRLKRIEGLPLGESAADPVAVVDAVIAQLGLDQGPLALGQAQKDILLAYVTDDGARVSLDLSRDDTDDARIKVRGLVALALQTAEMQVF